MNLQQLIKEAQDISKGLDKEVRGHISNSTSIALYDYTCLRCGQKIGGMQTGGCKLEDVISYLITRTAEETMKAVRPEEATPSGGNKMSPQERKEGYNQALTDMDNNFANYTK